jgi:lysine 2,3-aminomutase
MVFYSYTLPQRISSYLNNLIENTGGASGPIGRQFFVHHHDHHCVCSKTDDPLDEHKHEVAPGLVYKYKGKLDRDGNIRYWGRVLWTISRFCAAYCQFCTRGRFVGIPGTEEGTTKDCLSTHSFLSQRHIDQALQYIRTHDEIRDVILSGGDPLVTPREYLSHIMDTLSLFQKYDKIDVIRIHTRLPITNPTLLKDWHYDLIRNIDIPRISLHINHPAEITPEVRSVVKRFRETGAVLYSQSVLLKGVNDTVETLQDLFTEITKQGIHPYYLYQNDPVPWARDFTVPFGEAVRIWQELRPRLSGIAATAKFVVDVPQGTGKVPIPEGVWGERYEWVNDYDGKKHLL